MSGDRKFGFGIDVMRAWAAFKDTDKTMHFQKDQLEQINKEVKLFRLVIRSLLGYLHSCDINQNPYSFEKLTIVDKFMMLRLLEFTKQAGKLYDSYDLKGLYSYVQEFVVGDVSQYYLSFIKYRVVSRKNTDEFHSTMHVLTKILGTLTMSIAPIMCYSAQDIFDHMPIGLFKNYSKPLTVF